MLRKLGASVRSLFRPGRMEGELDDELAFHVERETEENVRRGMGLEEARRAALLRFGGVAKAREESVEASRTVLLETVVQDIRYGLRTLSRSPGYATAAVLTLALGIGANTAIFSVVHGVLLQSLPYGGGDQLVRLRVDGPGAGIEDGRFSAPEVNDLATLSRTLSGVVEYHSMWFVLLGRPEPERVQTGVVSASFFDLLGVRPILGRTFLPGEDRHGAEAVLVLSHAYWQRSFGADPGVVGRVFRMNDRPHTVIGVLPPIPGYPDDNDLYMPISACPFRSAPHMEQSRDMGMMQAFGRMKPGVTLEAARKDLASVAARMAADHPESYPASMQLSIVPVALTSELTQRARPTFLVLLAAVGLVLLIACANVANLTLARLIRREKEMALRSALGAGRARLTRQLLTESLLIATLGGALGLLLAWGVHGLLVHFASRFSPRAGEIAIDASVLAFTLVVALATGLVLGLIPAVSARRSLTAALQQGGGGRSASSGGRMRTRNALIIGQVAVSFMLLIGAGLMLRTVWKLGRVDPGFRPERVLTSRLDLNFSRYTSPSDYRTFEDRLLEKLSVLPGVQSAALSGTFPLNEGGVQTSRFRIEGRAVSSPEALPRADFEQVSPDYFRTIAVPMVRGRAFLGTDRPETPRVAIINQSGARRFFPGEDPIGKRIQIANNTPGPANDVWIEIVGVVGDIRQYALSKPPVEQIYVALAQYPALSATCLIRTTSAPAQTTRQLREAVHAIGPEQPVDRFRTLEEVVAGSLESPRLTALLLALFAGLAVLITAAGIVGVISFSVGQRTQEFGVRMALGAEPRAVLAMVLRQGMTLVAMGLALGLAGALVLTRLLAGLLFEITPTDPATYLAVALVLGGAAAAACFVPARRATAVDPMVALRDA